MKNKKVIAILVGGVLVVALAAGALLFGAVSFITAQSNVRGEVSSLPLVEVANQIANTATGRGDELNHGGVRFPGGREADGTYLAEALGITVEELQAAQEAARIAAIDQLVADGWLTQKQADLLKQSDRGFHGFGFKGFGFRDEQGSVDMEALLAAELGISVEELQTARQEASDAALQAAVEAGNLTQEQADLMKASQALKDYIDPQTMTAEALGMTVEELQAAREAGKSMADLLEEQGLTAAQFQEAMTAARQAAVEKAVADGVITQEQADQILANGAGHGFFPGFGGKGGHGGRGGPGGFERFPGDQTAPAAPSQVTPDTNS